MAKNVMIKDRSIRIQVWDTAGQEAFRAVTRSYYKNSACAILVYDITNRKSFQDINSWLNECKDMCSKDIYIVLVGNKNDLDNQRAISKDEGKRFAEENNLKFYETSALNGNNIEELFMNASSDLIDKIESGDCKIDLNSNGIKIGKFPNKEVEESFSAKKNGCC
jgi:small GTP-binding protein